MNIFTRIVCLSLLITALIFFAFQIPVQSQIGSGNSLKTKAEKISGDKFRYLSRTNKGVNVYSVKKPSANMLNSIDKGFNELIQIAKKNKYRRNLNYSDYTIFIANADRTKNANGQYSPDIAVGSAQYSGTKYDKGGYIYAAGMVISFSPSAFLLAEHKQNFERVSEIVRYEGEHLVLYHNNRNLFNETADHSKGGGHPILH